jgi:hypothetical protein
MATTCVNCGRSYEASLLLGAQGLTQVLSCRVCPVDAVYAVCAQCTDLNNVAAGPCPRCGARNLWQAADMKRAGVPEESVFAKRHWWSRPR